MVLRKRLLFGFSHLRNIGLRFIFSNPRGSTTYGAKFSDAIRGEWGNKDYHDLMSTTNYVIKNFPQVDSTRLGIMGWSYGGIMTAWITSHTQKFKAAVCGAPVVDYTADYGETDAHIDSDYEFLDHHGKNLNDTENGRH